MFSDPQKVKNQDGTEVTLPRVDSGDFSSTYLSADGLTKLTLSTQNGKRKRHMARVDVAKVVPSTVIPTQNEEATASVYLVLDRPLQGFTAAELKKLIEGLTTFLSASTFAAAEKLIGSEN